MFKTLKDQIDAAKAAYPYWIIFRVANNPYDQFLATKYSEEDIRSGASRTVWETDFDEWLMTCDPATFERYLSNCRPMEALEPLKEYCEALTERASAVHKRTRYPRDGAWTMFMGMTPARFDFFFKREDHATALKAHVAEAFPRLCVF